MEKERLVRYDPIDLKEFEKHEQEHRLALEQKIEQRKQQRLNFLKNYSQSTPNIIYDSSKIRQRSQFVLPDQAAI